MMEILTVTMDVVITVKLRNISTVQRLRPANACFIGTYKVFSIFILRKWRDKTKL